MVRRATGDDLHDVINIGKTVWPATYEELAGPEYVAMGLAKWWTTDAVVPGIRQGRVLVAELDGEVVGMAKWGPEDGHQVLWQLYVLPQAHGHGAGSALLAEVIEIVRPDFPELWVSHAQGNETAARFLFHHGFTFRQLEAGSDPIPSLVWLGLDLTTLPEASEEIPGELASAEPSAGAPDNPDPDPDADRLAYRSTRRGYRSPSDI